MNQFLPLLISLNLDFVSAAGIVPSAFDCFLVMRSLKTLKLRMDQHMKSSLAVAAFLESHPMVEKVLHPGYNEYT